MGGLGAVGLAHKGGGGCGGTKIQTRHKNRIKVKKQMTKKKKMFVWKKLNETQAVCGRTEA